jgi:glucose/mannose-6-phosphate isomerase
MGGIMNQTFDLDDLDHLRAIDRDNMLAHIDDLADQFQDAWALAQSLPLPPSHQHPRQIVLCGMGGSAIGGDLTAALIAPTSPVPLNVVRGYDLPAYATGPDTLVIVSSYSGNTEETLSAAAQALDHGAQVLAITTGGQLATSAAANGYPVWQFDYKSQPRGAIGWGFGLLIGLAHRLGLAPALEANIAEGIEVLRKHTPQYHAASPVHENPAKRGAGQLMGRLPVIFGGGPFEPVARRWKCQLNENSKVWAEFEAMPEANHNAVVGIGFPADHNLNVAAIFISSPKIDHPRVRLRHDLTYRLCLQNAIMADKFHPQGESALAQMMHAIQFGDYVSFYTAIAYAVDPTEILPIVELKEQLARHS